MNTASGLPMRDLLDGLDLEQLRGVCGALRICWRSDDDAAELCSLIEEEYHGVELDYLAIESACRDARAEKAARLRRVTWDASDRRVDPPEKWDPR